MLDVGLCDESVEGLIALTGNPRLARDSYRRRSIWLRRSAAATLTEAGADHPRC